MPLSNVEIINSSKKIFVKSDENGVFQIEANVNDKVMFYLKDYIQKTIEITKDNLSKNIEVFLNKKAIELTEVEVIRGPSMKIDVSYNALKMEKIAKEQLSPKVTGVYTGEIQNGADFIALGKGAYKLVGKLFYNKDKESYKKVIPFKNFIQNKFSDDYLSKNLKLENDELELFFAFCEEDKNYQLLNEKSDQLELLQFLIKKRNEFK